MRLSGNESAREFIFTFEEKANKLIVNGLKIDNSLKMHTLLHCIPRRFKRVYLRIAKSETPSKPKPTFDQLKAIIIEEELMLNSIEEKKDSNNKTVGIANFAYRKYIDEH